MLIQNTPDLLKFTTSLGIPPYVTLDTEFISEKTYYPKLCLIQLAYGAQAAVIDPLSGLDLTPLIQFLKHPDIVKVFHAAHQDLAILWNDFKLSPTPVFDTQIAAMVCGFGDQVSYGHLVKVLAKVQLDKHSQIIDWSKRPLLDRHIDYAVADVTNLGPVYEQLVTNIEKRNRTAWIAEEMQELSNHRRYEFRLETQVAKLKMRHISQRRLAILHALINWREEGARSRNIPRGWLLKDLALRDIVSQPPKTLEALGRVRGIGGNARGAVGREILECIRKAEALPLADCPAVEPARSEEPVSESIMVLLRALLKHVCMKNDVAPKLVASRSDLEQIARGERTRVSEGWRQEIFGGLAEKLLQGQIALTLAKGEFKIVTLPHQ